jgi:predicted PurR-regulated permease PerM
LVPGWLIRLAAIGWRLLAATALGLVLIYICIVLSTVTASILVAAIVAATFAPYVLALRNRGWSRVRPQRPSSW